jgi:hypothetical protein
MSLMHPYAVTDRDGVRHTATLADCLNVQRTPGARQAILERRFHQVATPGGGVLQVEKAFVYLDLARGQAFLVQPPCERYRHADASALLERMLAILPAAMRAQAQQVRVAYGLEELREKIVAAEAGFDDRAIELMKAALMHDHPVLMTRARLRLALDSVDPQGAHFVAQYDHSPKAFTLTYATPELFVDDEKTLRRWSATMDRHDLYKRSEGGADHWVNYRRWLPSQDAVAQLHAVVQQLAKGTPPKPQSAAFRAMLARLPRGSALSGQGKQDLRRLFLWAKQKKLGKLQDALFELRFAVALEDTWYRNDDPNDIDTLWRLLKNLPDGHVEGNARLAEINLGAGSGGTYSPSASEIEIGSQGLAFKEHFQDTMRHEVGHSVHEGHPELVDGWLWQRFGWASFDTDAKGIDAWARLMLGKGWDGLPENEKTQLRSLLRQACGPGSVWGPRVTPAAPKGSRWRAEGFGPRLAFEQSGENWYENHARWHRANGRAFAVNFWYASLLVVDEATLDFIGERLPDAYAAMSPAEFFAEVYALYYDRDDPKRKKLPADVTKWMDENLGHLSATRGARPAAARRGVAMKTPRTPAKKNAQPGKGRPT